MLSESESENDEIIFLVQALARGPRFDSQRRLSFPPHYLAFTEDYIIVTPWPTRNYGI